MNCKHFAPQPIATQGTVTIGPFVCPWCEIDRLKGTLSLAEEGLANYAQENARLREFVEDLAGFDCDNYGKHLSPQPCGECWSCLARKTINGVPQSGDAAQHK